MYTQEFPFPAPGGRRPPIAGLSAFRLEGPSAKCLDSRRPFQFYGREAFFVVVRHVILISAIGMTSSVSVVHRAPRASADAGKPSRPRLALLRTSAPRSRRCSSLFGSVNRPETEPCTYTILLTANESRPELLEAMSAGAEDFLAKPFDPPELKAACFTVKAPLSNDSRSLTGTQLSPAL